MDYEQGACARCGEPAGDHGFCEPCRAHIESLTWMPIDDPGDAADRAQRAVLRLEQALAAVSNVTVNGAAGDDLTGAVQLNQGPQADGGSADAGSGPLDISRFSSSADERVTEIAHSPAHSPREVARLEDVLRIAPRAERPMRVSLSAVPDRDISHSEPSPDVPGHAGVHPVSPPRAVLSIAPPAEASPATPTADVTAAVGPDAILAETAAEPTSQAPFWFELVPAAQPAASEPPPTDVAQADPEPHVAEATSSVPPPGQSNAEAVEVEDSAPASPGRPDASRRNWILVLCLLGLIGLVVLLTGRELPRSTGARLS